MSKVTIRGVPAAFSQVNDKLTIRPRWPIRPWTVFKLAVEYSGVPSTIQDPTAPGDPELQLGWFKFDDASYVVSEPVGASTFFPANDEPTDKAPFTIAVTVPADYIGVANGALKSVRAIGTKKRFVWDMRQPMTTWLATVHINKFKVSRKRAPDGTPMHVYFPEGTPRIGGAGASPRGGHVPLLRAA